MVNFGYFWVFMGTQKDPFQYLDIAYGVSKWKDKQTEMLLSGKGISNFIHTFIYTLESNWGRLVGVIRSTVGTLSSVFAEER